MSIYTIRVTDDDIVTAYLAASGQLKHPDSPSEMDLGAVRDKLPLREAEMLSLHWLRNRIVTLRKNGRLAKQTTMRDAGPTIWDAVKESVPQ